MKRKACLLGDVCKFIDYRGKTPPKTNAGIPLITAKIIKHGAIQEPQEFIEESFYDEWMRRGIPKVGDVIFTTEAPLGEVAQIKTDEKLAFAQRVIILESDEKVLHPDYLFYALQDIVLKSRIEARSSGTTVFGIKASELKKVKIDLPVMETQKKIGTILSAIDDKIALNQQINKNLEEQAQALYQSIADVALNKAPLSDFIGIKHGYAFKGKYIQSIDNNIVLVTPGNFRIGGGFQENKCKYFSADYSEDYILQPGNLIVTMTDLSKEADTLGYGAIVPDNPHRIYLHNQRIGLVEIFNDMLSKDYIYWYMRSYKYHNFIVGSASGSTVKHTSPKRILEQRIPIPSEKDKEKLDVLIHLDSLISFNDTVDIQLANLRDALLPRLMSGEIDVSGIDIKP